MRAVEAGEPLGASYRFVERLGSGAVGEVWTVRPTAAEDPSDDVLLAAKVLRAEHAEDAGLVERFVRERSVLLGLRAPGIVPVRDLVVDGGRLAIVMDLVAGGSLAEVVAAHAPLRPADALAFVARILDALAAAHAAGVVHRDIKPDNVLLARAWQPGQDAELFVSDFGIASVVQQGGRHSTGLVGTPQYMAPELISRGETGPEGDVYAAGVLLYQLLCGRTPFAGPGTDFTIAYRHVTSVPPPLPVGPELGSFLERLLSKAPGTRPAAAEAAATARRLASALADEPALEPSGAPEDFGEAEHPATVVRGMGPGAVPDAGGQGRAGTGTAGTGTLGGATGSGAGTGSAAASGSEPELGEPGSATVARPMPRAVEPVFEAPSAQAGEGGVPAWRTAAFWRSRKGLGIAAAALAVVAALVVTIVLVVPHPKPGPAPAAEALTAHRQAQPLPTGLTITRDARYDPAQGKVQLTLTYTAQKSPLSGDLLEIIPRPGGGSCPAATFTGAEAKRNRAEVTGVDAGCGWQLTGVSIPAGQSVEVSAAVNVGVQDQQELDAWLESEEQLVEKAATDSDVKGSAYPVQRLQDIQVRTPQRVVSASTVKVTLVPVWAGGADDLDPLYVSPATGKATQVLKAVAGGEDGVRFSDGCSGALAVDSSGLTVTALQISPQCTVRARVGNFTDLASEPFSVTSREAK